MTEKGFCPMCGKQLDYGDFILDTLASNIPLGRHEVDCMDCEWAGYEWYKLEFLRHGNR